MGQTVNQPTKAPTRKLMAVAVTAVVTYGLTQYFGGEIPPELVPAIPALAGLVVGYLVKERAPEGPDETITE